MASCAKRRFKTTDRAQLPADFNLGAQDKFMAYQSDRMKRSCLLQLHIVTSSDKPDLTLTIVWLQWHRAILLSENICLTVCAYLCRLKKKLPWYIKKLRVKEYQLGRKAAQCHIRVLFVLAVVSVRTWQKQNRGGYIMIQSPWVLQS